MFRKLTYYGHSCFLLEADNGWKAVFDPYQHGSVPGLHLPPLSADRVFKSHEHADHNAEDRVTIGHSAEDPYTVTSLLTDHDDRGGALRGKNTVYILACGAEKIVHLGDLGRNLREEEISALKNADLVMIPCGGHFTIDAAQAKQLIALIQPKTAVLMHYRSGSQGYDVIASKQDVQRVIPEAVDTGVSVMEAGQYEGILFLNADRTAVTDGE